MDNFKIIYKILRYLEKSMDFEERDTAPITADALGVSQERWLELMVMLSENGYISGVAIKRYVRSLPQVSNLADIRITLKGLEYLQENSLMRKAEKLAQGVVDVAVKL